MCGIISLDIEMKFGMGGCMFHFYEMTSNSHISQKHIYVCVCGYIYIYMYMYMYIYVYIHMSMTL